MATFLEILRAKNVQRCEGYFNHLVDDWSNNDWFTPITGEFGEPGNLFKKMKRGDEIEFSEVEKEIADVFTYLDLLCAKHDIDIALIVMRKFNEVSDRRNCPIKFTPAEFALFASRKSTKEALGNFILTLENVQVKPSENEDITNFNDNFTKSF